MVFLTRSYLRARWPFAAPPELARTDGPEEALALIASGSLSPHPSRAWPALLAASVAAGLGAGGEGFTSMSIASPTGEGMTRARTFTRWRRCVLVDRFRIV